MTVGRSLMRLGFERRLPLDLHGKVHDDDGEGIRHRARAVLGEQRHDVVKHRTIFLVSHRRFLLGGVKHFQESLDDPPFQPGSRYGPAPARYAHFGQAHTGDLQKRRYTTVYPRCAQLADDNIEILIGSQSDRTFLRDVRRRIGQVDILLDDGGHTMRQQIITFEELFPLVARDGVYVVEDLHTSYWPSYGGGLKRRGTFIEYSKNFIDHIHAFHSRQWNFRVNELTKSVASLHFYDSVLVVEKHVMHPPSAESTGIPVIDHGGREALTWSRLNDVVRRNLSPYVNVVLGWLGLPGIN